MSSLLSCMSLHVISVFDKVYKLSSEKSAPAMLD